MPSITLPKQGLSLRSTARTKQAGQAMVEYAILLILLVTLVVGGAELGITAYSASRITEAAKAGANAWSEAVAYNQSGAGLSESERQDRLEVTREALRIDTDPDLAQRDPVSGALLVPATCDLYPEDTCPVSADADEIRPQLGDLGQCIVGPGEDVNNNGVLDAGEDTNGNGLLDFDYYNPDRLDGATLPQFSPDLPIDITHCDTTKPDFLRALRGLLFDMGMDYSNADPMMDYYEVCTSRLNDDQIEKIVTCRPTIDVREEDADNDGLAINEDTNGNGLLDTGEDTNGNDLLDREDINANGTPDNNPNGTDDADPSFRRLLIARLDANGNPQTPAIANNRITLGNHDPARTDFPFRYPSCLGGGAFDDGLPSDGRIYLFNPLPIDVTNCTGGNNSVNDLMAALPALNQATVSQYTKVCVTLNAGQISYATDPTNPNRLLGLSECVPNGGRIWMKPPGKMCGAAGGSEVCPDPADIQGDGDNVFGMRGATGYYFFGNANVATGRHEFTPENAGNPSGSFRPMYQLVCDGATARNPLVDAGGQCQAIGNTSSVQALEVNVRYRAIFDSFLTFGLDELTSGALIPYYHNPTKVGQGSSNLVGMVGAELGPIGANRRPTVKKHRDFRGCSRVTLTAPDTIGTQVKTTVSSCN